MDKCDDNAIDEKGSEAKNQNETDTGSDNPFLTRLLSENEILHLSGNFEDFARFDRQYDIRLLTIDEGRIESFAYFVERFPNLQGLWVFNVYFGESARAIPYIEGLRDLRVWHPNALDLMANNSHISGYLSINLGYFDEENLVVVWPGHVDLAPLYNFTNMRSFTFAGDADSIDAIALLNAQSLVTINFSRGVSDIINLKYLANLPNLTDIFLPLITWSWVRPNFDWGYYLEPFERNGIYVGWGS